MGSNVFPAPSAGGGIKSVQRGSAGASGNVTITSVDISKSFVNIYGTASSGTVAASGSINAASGSNSRVNIGRNSNYWGAGSQATEIAQQFLRYGSGSSQNAEPSGLNNNYSLGVVDATSITLNSTNLTGGSNNLVAAVVQGFLANSTTLTVSGACRWEVVEFA